MYGFVVGDKLLTVTINNCRIQIKHLLAGSNFSKKPNCGSFVKQNEQLLPEIVVYSYIW